MSHYRAWEKLASSNGDLLLVLEDDVCAFASAPQPHAMHLLSAFQPTAIRMCDSTAVASQVLCASELHAARFEPPVLYVQWTKIWADLLGYVRHCCAAGHNWDLLYLGRNQFGRVYICFRSMPTANAEGWERSRGQHQKRLKTSR